MRVATGLVSSCSGGDAIFGAPMGAEDGTPLLEQAEARPAADVGPVHTGELATLAGHSCGQPGT